MELREPCEVRLRNGRSLHDALVDYYKWKIDNSTGKPLDISGEDLSGIDLVGHDFRYVLAVDTNFRGSKIRHSMFSGTQFDGTDFRDVLFTGVSMKHCGLRGANFRGADATGLRLVDCTTDGMKAGPRRRRFFY